jgi:hypothetical protein
MSRISLLFGLTVLCLTARAGEVFDFKALAACDEEHDAYGPDSLSAKRVGGDLVVTGFAGIACGQVPKNPRVLPDWGSVTLSLEYSTDGPIAVCRCTSKFEFIVRQQVVPGKTIYLVKDGKGSAHVVAP